ncbi:MAG: cyclopropane-fatty-acyl-phospholipid synthase family protein [Metallibacterium scheffleri]|jgi:cyclopropane-fatty-acyl-phospholipid synthase|uniref:SAM-dependent methyltransferase n=1 Tax=Metallibacterium scheffleri TaxID=993689 RepID=UPI0026F12057|nr:cyclopropane-fatty-acyl-phospholipid synthase family protein [Metallibacterium scheffleri]MCK9367268.1 cyclopropane-fatty-acyl-phospholipid synthase family protein [Metallibacterium scheffleri]
MSTQSTDLPQTTANTQMSFIVRKLRDRLLGMLGDIDESQLRLNDAAGMMILGRCDAHAVEPLTARVDILDPTFYLRVATQGSIGAGEAYMDGLWRSDDLVALMRMLVRHRDRLDTLDSGSARVAGTLLKLWHALRRNSRQGSRRNIAAHYDLGNALFELFLSGDMMYSSAIYAYEGEALEDASWRKLDRVCRKLELSSTDHVLEIGTGWGGFAIHAARHYGCHVTTTTISREQYDLARARVADAGLSQHVEVLLQDYRDLDGHYDKLVSIEMVEAIGHQYLDRFFARIAELLKPHGAALLQAITIEDVRYRKALREVDFIKRHIFPGSFIPCVSALSGALARSSDLRLVNLEDIGPSYAMTLQAWRQRFLARLPEVRALGYDERFIRMWEFYLAYCEAGFRERALGDVQMLLHRPRARTSPWLPAVKMPCAR